MASNLESGSIRALFQAIFGPRGTADATINRMVAGNAYSGNKLGISPFFYLPESEATRRETMMYNWKSGAQIAADMGTTDGTTSDLFFVNTNSATYTATSSQAGYEGEGVLTTGGSTGNHAGFIGCPSYLSVAGQVGVCYTSIYLPDVANAYDFYFGFSNKTIAPGTSGTYMTDGAVVRAITAAGSITLKLDTASNAANNDQATNHTVSAAKLTVASGAAVGSLQLAIVLHGQASADMWIRQPGAATNAWTKFNQTTNIPRGTIQMRPHLLPVTRNAGTTAVQVQDFAYWWLRPTTW